MSLRRRLLLLLSAALLVVPPARALFNLNEGKDQIYSSASYSIGYDSNVFTRASGRGSFTQNASVAIDYARQAGLISVAANVSASSGSFNGIRGQDFLDPSCSISLRKRYGRTTGSIALSGRRESQPDPDVGERTRSWNYALTADVRYPVNDRYYLTNNLRGTSRVFSNQTPFTDLNSISDGVAINYIYTSKLDLNGAYTLGISDTSHGTKAYDHSFTVGASGSLLAKLSGTVNFGMERRNSRSATGGSETFDSFTSATTLRWVYSRRLSFNGDLSQSFSTSATDVSVNRGSAGLHTTASIGSRYVANAGIAYTKSDFLGKAGAGRSDEMLQFDASIGLALNTHFRATLSYIYMINYSNFAVAEFERHSVTLGLLANY